MTPYAVAYHVGVPKTDRRLHRSGVWGTDENVGRVRLGLRLRVEGAKLLVQSTRL